MKYVSTAIVILTLSACGQVKVSIPKNGASGNITVTINTDPVPSALGDVQSCPSGMTLVNSGIGNSAYCIDSLPSATGAPVTHASALSSCNAAGKTLCSVQQLSLQCSAGNLNAAYIYWTNEISGGAGPAIFATAYTGSTCSSPGGYSLAANPTKQFYCCSR